MRNREGLATLHRLVRGTASFEALLPSKAALFIRSPSLEGALLPRGPRRQPRSPERRRCGRARLLLPAVRARLLRSSGPVSRSPRTEVLRIDRSLYGQCRALGAFFTRAEARRARSPWPLGRSGDELRFRVGAVPAVTPVLFDRRLQPTIRLVKNGHSPCLGPLRSASHAGGSLRSHAERLIEAVPVPYLRRLFLMSGVERTSGASSSKPRAQRTTCVAPETPGPRQNDVRRRRPGPHEVTSSLARPQVETRRSRQPPPEPRERCRAWICPKRLPLSNSLIPQQASRFGRRPCPCGR